MKFFGGTAGIKPRAAEWECFLCVLQPPSLLWIRTWAHGFSLDDLTLLSTKWVCASRLAFVSQRKVSDANLDKKWRHCDHADQKYDRSKFLILEPGTGVVSYAVGQLLNVNTLEKLVEYSYPTNSGSFKQSENSGGHSWAWNGSLPVPLFMPHLFFLIQRSRVWIPRFGKISVKCTCAVLRIFQTDLGVQDIYFLVVPRS